MSPARASTPSRSALRPHTAVLEARAHCPNSLEPPAPAETRESVNRRSSLTPPSLDRSIAWLADRRRDPTSVDSNPVQIGKPTSHKVANIRDSTKITEPLNEDP